MIRKYEIADIPVLIELFDSNIPEYFAEEELEPFVDFLNGDREHYYVLEENDEIIGGAGFEPREDGTVFFCYGMIHHDHHKKGLGKLLLEFRLQKIKELYPGKDITVRTTQNTDQFFAKFGFETVYTENDYWAKGLHLYKMILKANGAQIRT